MSLAAAQIDALLAPLDPRRVRTKDRQSHLEAWDIRRHLIRVFGWGGWDFTVVSYDCILERSSWTSDKPEETHRGRHTVAYRVIGRLTIKDPDGKVVAVFEDGATGDAQNQPTFADAHDMALKTAMSQALKRCAVNLGDRFGLSLYNKSNDGSAVVGRTVAHEGSAEHDASEDVTAGELDEPIAPGGAEEPASTPTASEGGEGSNQPPADPPAPASSDLNEAIQTITVMQADLSAAKRRNLHAWLTAHGHTIAKTGGVDVTTIATVETAHEILEHLASIQRAA